MYIPNEIECLDLLRKYNTPEHIVAHSVRVRDVGHIIGSALVRLEHPVDLDLLAASCLLHDIGKYPCIVDGSSYHDVRGETILTDEGFPVIASIIVQHVVLRTPKYAPIAEEHVLFYADKRVVHDQIVTLKERFEYLFSTYGKSPEAIYRLNIMKNETMDLEKGIFALVDFDPDDLLILPI